MVAKPLRNLRELSTSRFSCTVTLALFLASCDLQSRNNLFGDDINQLSQSPSVSVTQAAGSADLMCHAVPATLADANAQNRYEYQWFQNGTLVPGAAEATLRADKFTKGNKIACAAGVKSASGAAQKFARSPEFTIPNRAPMAGTVVLSHLIPEEGDSVECLATGFTDPDADPVTLRYVWLRNGVAVDGLTSKFWNDLEGSAGDKISCLVQASDQASEGASIEPLRSPEVTSSPSLFAKPSKPAFEPVPDQVVAEGTELLFSLKTSATAATFACLDRCPRGLAVDATSGLVQWRPDFVQAGTHSVVVSTLRKMKLSTQSVNIVVLNTSRTPDLAIVTPSATAYRSNSVNQVLAGTCSKEPLTLTANIAGSFLNSCESTGHFSFFFALAGTKNVALTATTSSNETKTVQVSATLDVAIPQVAITSPTLQAEWVTDSPSVTLSGTCSTNVTTLTVTPEVAFTDSNCSDGTWSLAPHSFGLVRLPFIVTAKTAAGNTQTAKLNVIKTIVVGQDNLTSQQHLSLPSGGFSSWTDGTRYAVAQPNSNRILIWNTVPTTAGVSPNIVLGQPDSHQNTANNGGLSARSLYHPREVWSNGTKLAVADSLNNRVLIWNTFPTSNFQPADVVLGQTKFTSNDVNAGGVGPSSMSFPHSLGSDGIKFFVAEFNNSRVLIWNTFPTAHAAPADVVLGQSNFSQNTFNSGGLNGSGLTSPNSLSVCAGMLFVSDMYNNRVLAWNSIPTSNATAANFALGQPGLTTGSSNNGGISANSLSNQQGVFCDGSRLFVADRLNNRVLVWNTLPTASGQPADVVLGQANMTASNANSGGLSAKSLYLPFGISGTSSRIYVADDSNGRVLSWPTTALANFAAADRVIGKPDLTSGTEIVGLPVGMENPSSTFRVGTKLIVSDSTRNRILIWNQVPTNNTVPADVVLGQPDLYQITANNGGVSAKSLYAPWDLWSDGTKLVVSDRLNNRVLVWTTFPTAHFTSADIVIGQASMATNASAITATGLNAPQGVSSDGTRLIVSDTGNNRILLWNTFPTAPGTAANIVLGQNLMTTNTPNNGGITAKSLINPTGVHTAGGKLFTIDRYNNRVLIWNTLPTVNFTDADVVLGQPTMTVGTANNGGLSNKSLSGPVMVRSNGTELVVSDYSNNRVLIWNTIPTLNHIAADRVIGQSGFLTNAANSTFGGNSLQGTYGPHGLWLENQRLWVTDINHRVLLWNALPTQNWAPADVAIGQVTSIRKETVSAQSLWNPHDSVRANGKLIIADHSNNRVLIWNTVPATSGVPADVVIGQPDMTTNTPNTGGLSARSLYTPAGVASDGTRLLISDTSNHRILVFNSIPTANNAAADLVLGQPDFVSNMANNGGISAKSLNAPAKLYFTGGALLISEVSNSRVMRWNTLPSTNFAPADLVLGQPNFTSNTPHLNGISGATLNSPDGVFEDSGRIFVSDRNSNRILIWNAIPSANGAPADIVIGQPDMFASAVNNGGVSGQSLYSPQAPVVSNGKLYVSDVSNYRLLIWNSIPTQNFQSADAVVGQGSFFTNTLKPLSGSVLNVPAGHSAGSGTLVIPNWNGHRVLLMPEP